MFCRNLACSLVLQSLCAIAAVSQPKYVLPIDASWGSPLFIEARLNGSEPMRFILDSASTWSMVRRAEATKLGLKTDRSETGSGAGGPFQMDFTRATLQVGSFRLNDLELGVTNLPAHYAGILGADLFAQYIVSIDYEAGRLSLYDPDKFHPDPGATRVELNIRGRIPCVPASVAFGDKEARGEFRLDTASFAAMTLNAPFAARNSLPPSDASVRRLEAGSLSGAVQFVQARAARIRIGGAQFENPIVQIYASNRGSGTGTVLAGHIGNQILRRFRVTFDYGRRQLFLEPNSVRSEPFEIDMSGLIFGPSFEVASVEKGSVAEAAGIQKGDVVTRIDGVPVEKLGLARAHDMLMRDGNQCDVEVSRGGGAVVARLALKRLF